MKKGIIIILVCLFLMGCAAPPPEPIETPTPMPTATRTPWPTTTPDLCYFEVLDFIENGIGVWNEWYDVVILAETTPKIALPSVIQDMQSIKRELSTYEPVHCANDIVLYDSIYGAMDETILAYLAFLGGDSNSVVEEHLQNAMDFMDTANEEMDIAISLD